MAKTYKRGRDLLLPAEKEVLTGTSPGKTPGSSFASPAQVLAFSTHSGLHPLKLNNQRGFQQKNLGWCLVVVCQGFMSHWGGIRLDLSCFDLDFTDYKLHPNPPVLSSLGHVGWMQYCPYTLNMPLTWGGCFQAEQSHGPLPAHGNAGTA